MDRQFAQLQTHFSLLCGTMHRHTVTLASHHTEWIIVAVALAMLFLWALRLIYGILRFVGTYFLRPGKNLRVYGWAVVTGATDGIGKAYCEELARKGGFASPLLLSSSATPHLSLRHHLH
jgi:hypothetical protein